MEIFLMVAAFTGGYVASVYTWAWVRTTFLGVEGEIVVLRNRLASLTGHKPV